MVIVPIGFNFYFDSEMKDQVEEYTIHFTGKGSEDFTFYFGSTNKTYQLWSATNKIQIWPESNLQKWTPNREVRRDFIVEPPTPNGYYYRCMQSGKTGQTEPVWPSTGEVNNDNSVIWKCLGKKIRPEDVKMALERSSLKDVEGGAKLDIGAEIKGGESIPIYFRVTNTDSTIRSDLFHPCISIKINDVILTYPLSKEEE